MVAVSAVPGYEAGEERVLVGGEFFYSVQPRDSLTLIGARFGVAAGVLARENGLGTGDLLRVGQVLRIDNRHVVPFLLEDGILVNVSQRLLFLFRSGRLVCWYPVGLGRLKWETTLGQFEVRTRERSPVWHVPASIQEEMLQRGEEVRTRVAPGPDNPVGDYWLGLTGSRCGIHGTNAPASIYQFRTHGCVRLHPDDIADIFARVAKGTRVWIVDEPLLLAQTTDGAVFLECNPSIGGQRGDAAARVAVLAERQNVRSLLDDARVEKVVAATEGIARRIDRGSGRGDASYGRGSPQAADGTRRGSLSGLPAVPRAATLRASDHLDRARRMDRDELGHAARQQAVGAMTPVEADHEQIRRIRTALVHETLARIALEHGLGNGESGAFEDSRGGGSGVLRRLPGFLVELSYGRGGRPRVGQAPSAWGHARNAHAGSRRPGAPGYGTGRLERRLRAICREENLHGGAPSPARGRAHDFD